MGTRVTLAPSFANMITNHQRAARVGRLNLVIGLAALSLAATRGQLALWLLAIPLGWVLIEIVWSLWYVLMVRIRIDGDTIVVRHGRFLADRTIRRTAVDRIRLFEVRQEAVLPRSNGGFPTYKVLLLDRTNVILHRLAGWGWNTTQLAELASTIGVHVDPDWLIIEAADLRDELPGSVNWFEATPTWAKLPFVVLACVLIAAVVGSTH